MKSLLADTKIGEGALTAGAPLNRNMEAIVIGIILGR